MRKARRQVRYPAREAAGLNRQTLAAYYRIPGLDPRVEGMPGFPSEERDKDPGRLGLEGQ